MFFLSKKKSYKLQRKRSNTGWIRNMRDGAHHHHRTVGQLVNVDGLLNAYQKIFFDTGNMKMT